MGSRVRLMQIHISSRHLKLTWAIQAFVTQKISHLEHLTDDIIGAHVVLDHDELRNPSKAFSVKVHLAVPGPDIHIEEHKSDLYAAIDLAVNKLERQVRKRKTKIVDKKKAKAQRTAERIKRHGI
jgi:putative sigma-54 modulation protein